MRASKSQRAADRPTFLVGMPRSGTSIMFAAFAAHTDLSWFSQYMDRFPALPGLALLSRIASVEPGAMKATVRQGHTRGLADRMRIEPTEAYGVWNRCCGDRFVFDYLLGAEATPAEARCVRRRVETTMRLQNKPRFAAKLTGPGRISYVSSIFPRARFVHVIRDPRAVVDSLLRVPFWRDTFRQTEPAWKGGLDDAELQAWKRAGTPEALAAVQWGAVVRTIRDEARQRDESLYTEVKYEDFIAQPHATLTRLFTFAELGDDARAHRFLDERLALVDLTAGWRDRLSSGQIEVVEQLLAEPIRELGYEPMFAH